MLESKARIRSWSKSPSKATSRPHLQAIDVPLALLLTKDLTPAAKFLWTRLRFDEIDARIRTSKRRRPHAPAKLAKRTVLARSTIYQALKRATTTGWLVPEQSGGQGWRTACPVSPGPSVKIRVDLIRSSHALRPQAILCYGLLQAVPSFNGRAGNFKWAELSRLAGLHLKTVKRAVQELVDARWIYVVQRNRVSPVEFFLQDADQAQKEAVQRDLENADFKGEGIMRSILSLIADGKECHDGSKPDFLVNPSTGNKLEFDRYYPFENVAFEFNGPQHYRPTGRFTKREVTAQRKRDAVKRKICKDKEVALVVVHGDDLSIPKMLKKIGDLLPRRALRGLKKTIRFLNECGRRYQAKIKDERVTSMISPADPRLRRYATSS